MADETEYKIPPKVARALKQINQDTDLAKSEIKAIRTLASILGSPLLNNLLNAEVEDG